MTAVATPPPGWQERLDWLLATYDRAWADLLAGRPWAETKIRVARRQLETMLAQRP